MTAAGTTCTITDRQDAPEHHRRLLAYSRRYGVAGRWRNLQAAASVAFAAVPFVTVALHTEAPPVVGAVAAAYLVLARTLLGAAQRRAQHRAALVQERYDTGLFRIRWNGAVAGVQPSVDDIEADAEAFLRSRRYRKDPTKYDRWYEVDLTGVDPPNDALLCQRQSTVWSRMDHNVYATTLYWLFAALLVATVALSLVRGQLLADYLVLVFLPTAPAALDLLEQAQAHRREAAARSRLESDVDAAWSARQEGFPVSLETVRRLQDALYLSRRDGPKVPHHFYRLLRSRRSAVTALGVEALRRES